MTKRLPPELPDFDELERFGAAGFYSDARLALLYREMERQRVERAHRIELAMQLELARDLLDEQEARAAIEQVVLPTDGDDSCAMILALRGDLLATEERDGRQVEYRLGGVLGLVDGETWERIGEQVRESLRQAHRGRRGEPATFVLVEPGGRRTNLLDLVPASPPLAMSRADLVHSLVTELPACAMARRFYLSALESRDPVAPLVARTIRRTFASSRRLHELEPKAAAE
jgi:hypothetical protein